MLRLRAIAGLSRPADPLLVEGHAIVTRAANKDASVNRVQAFEAWKQGVKDEAAQQAQRMCDWMLDPSYGTWIGPEGSTAGVSPFRDRPRDD